MTRTDRDIGWIAGNIAGTALFIGLASRSWIEPELAGIAGASGGQALVWFTTAVPILAVFALAHLLAAARAIIQLARKRDWTAPAPVLITGGLWMAAIWFDNLHHGA
jgi:hypothetical protein